MTFELEQFLVLALLFLPFCGAVIVWILGPNNGNLIKTISFGVSALLLVMASVLAYQFAVQQRVLDRPSPEELKVGQIATFVPDFVPGSTEDQPHKTTWDLLQVGAGKIQFFLGVDGLNIWLIVLTAVLFMPSVLISFWHVKDRVNEFFAWLMLLQTCLMGVFFSFDIMLFYFFFEVSLVPLFFLIGIWGGSQREYASRKFVIYTLTGSLITLLGVIGTVIACSTYCNRLIFSIPELVSEVHLQLANPDPAVRGFWQNMQIYTFLAMALGLAVKVPLIPFHTWLPLAHVEAPTAGSVDLAGILLKLGSYGFLRLAIPLAPDAALSVGLPALTWLAAIGVVYGAFCALSQTDIKRLVAYSSVSHIGLCMLGMFSFTMAGLQGSILYMINHGLSTGALFLLIGMIYDRYHTRQIKDYGGMAKVMPIFGMFMVLFSLSSIGLPGLNGFISEFLCLAGIFEYEMDSANVTVPILTFIGASGIILNAWYMLNLMRGVLFGEVKEPVADDHYPKQLTFREWGMLAPLAVLCFVLGLYPMPVLKTTEPDIDRIALVVEQARVRAGLLEQTYENIPPQAP